MRWIIIIWYNNRSWLTIKNGQEQYFYVLPDRKAFVMGVLFDNKGKLVTVNQVQRLRSQGDSLLDTLASEDFGLADRSTSSSPDAFEFKSPSERLYFDIENSNWVPLGPQGAPVAYSFIDPQCPHCHAFINDLRDAILKTGQIQLRMIPVGFKEETRAQAAFLMATPNPQTRWFRHMEGDETALPAKSEINQQGVQRNLAVMQSWDFNATPMVIYRAKDGSVKIVQGRPKDLPALLDDLGFSFEAAVGGFRHPTMTTIVDADGRIYRQVYGDAFPDQVFIEPLKELVYGTTMRSTAVADLLDRIRFICTVYNPSSGAYEFDYAIAFGIVIGGLSLVLTGFVIFRLWRANRRIANIRAPEHRG